MTIEIIVHTAPPPDWDRRMATAGASLLQSGFWGSLMVELARGTPYYLEVIHEGKCLASLLAIHMRRAGKRGWIQHIGERLLGLHRGRVEFGDGPVIHVTEFESQSIEALLDWVDRYARSHGIGVIRAGGKGQTAPEIFAARGYKSTPWATYLVDLRLDEDPLLMSFEHAARKGIKKAIREEVRIQRVETWQSYLDLFLRPYLDWTGAEESGKLSLGDAQQIWDHAGHHDYYRYYVAVLPDEKPLAVLGMYLFAGVATEITSAVSPEAIERKIPAQDLLHWEMFLAAKREGCHTFDLAGVSPEPSTSKEANIRRFKKKWGGRYEEYPTYEWRNPKLSTALSVLATARHIWMFAKTRTSRLAR